MAKKKKMTAAQKAKARAQGKFRASRATKGIPAAKLTGPAALERKRAMGKVTAAIRGAGATAPKMVKPKKGPTKKKQTAKKKY